MQRGLETLEITIHREVNWGLSYRGTLHSNSQNEVSVHALTWKAPQDPLSDRGKERLQPLHAVRYSWWKQTHKNSTVSFWTHTHMHFKA